MVYNDLTFFTNEPERDLYSRFNTILQNNTQFFDVLVGYFRTSGFFKLYPAMKDIEKIRVLVGLNVDAKTLEIIHQSHKEAKNAFGQDVESEFNESEDSPSVEQGVRTFIEWLRSGKIEMRIYPDAPLHAKIYIIRKNPEKDPERFGSVITGSSNFSLAGLSNNLEFNVELKDSRDVGFALEKFTELWEKSIDISEAYIETIEKKTWLRDDITPYELYLKTLYEYFKEEINTDKEAILDDILPDGFMRLQYQLDAVVEAEKKLEAYGGVFISDVVGLGKTYICAMLAKKVRRGKKLFICPPVLKEYWEQVLRDFDVAARVESLGKLEKLINEGIDNYKYVFIDESHRFRNEATESFTLLREICYGKKVVLISATPINNYSSDIENQIYLFQPKYNSSIIPNMKNLEGFFRGLHGKLKKLEKGTPEYAEQMRHNSEEIRDKLIRNIMIRRTRKEITEYFADDIKRQGLTFPKLGTPEKIVYTFDAKTDKVFSDTIAVIRDFSYARYKPLFYLKHAAAEQEKQKTAQANLGGFMKGILVKRLESSFFAFRKTLGRFIESYTRFIDMYNDGEVYISKKVDVYDMLDSGDDDRLFQFVEAELVQHFKSSDFRDDFIKHMENDLAMLMQLQDAWETVDTDPKLDGFKQELAGNPVLSKNKLIIFTESKETATYLGDELSAIYGDSVIVFSGGSSAALKQQIEYSYNPKHADKGEDKYNILITTDVLAEGINLHRSCVIINYDLPWNPTRIMQRVGRINRVGTAFDRIYVFNFFPTARSDEHLPLRERITQKLQAFHDTLGEDFKYLSDDEQVTSHKLYSDLTTEMEEDEGMNPELYYLTEVRRIRDEETPLFDKIKRLPLKAKSGKHSPHVSDNATVTFLRRGYLKMFFKTECIKTDGITFIEAIKLIKASPEEKRIGIGAAFFDGLAKNKSAFDDSLIEEDVADFDNVTIKGNDAKIIKLLKALSKCKKFTDTQEEIVRKMIQLWQEGEIPAKITKDALKLIKPEIDELQLFSEILDLIPERYFSGRNQKKVTTVGEKQVVLSCWLNNEEGN